MWSSSQWWRTRRKKASRGTSTSLRLPTKLNWECSILFQFFKKSFHSIWNCGRNSASSSGFADHLQLLQKWHGYLEMSAQQMERLDMSRTYNKQSSFKGWLALMYGPNSQVVLLHILSFPSSNFFISQFCTWHGSDVRFWAFLIFHKTSETSRPLPK